jgi:hypothetical protein
VKSWKRRMEGRGLGRKSCRVRLVGRRSRRGQGRGWVSWQQQSSQDQPRKLGCLAMPPPWPQLLLLLLVGMKLLWGALVRVLGAAASAAGRRQQQRQLLLGSSSNDGGGGCQRDMVVWTHEALINSSTTSSSLVRHPVMSLMGKCRSLVHQREAKVRLGGGGGGDYYWKWGRGRGGVWEVWAWKGRISGDGRRHVDRGNGRRYM